MHEVSVVRNIFKTLEETYPERYHAIVKVKIEAGLLSNIQPILIQNAFEALCVEEPELKKVEVEVNLLPIIAYCHNCQKDFEVKYHRFVCTCGTPSQDILQGDELQISKIDFENN
jgi:hydrogenase nickel incorporation protein HypA/HybF